MFYEKCVLDESFHAAETERLEKQGFCWPQWSAPTSAHLLLLKEKSSENLIHLQWVVDVLNDERWTIGTAYSFDKITGKLEVACPDNDAPIWKGAVSFVSKGLSILESSFVRLVECCDVPEKNPASVALYVTAVRTCMKRIDWLLEWTVDNDTINRDSAVGPEESSPNVRTGRALWFSNLTNQLLCVPSVPLSPMPSSLPRMPETCMIVDISIHSEIRIFGVGASGEGSKECSNLVEQGLARMAGLDVKPMNASGGSSYLTYGSKTTTIFRDQLELLIHYQHDIQYAMESTLILRNESIREQKDLIEQLQSFVFEGDLINGHKLLGVLNKRMNKIKRQHDHQSLAVSRVPLHPKDILEHTCEVEEDLWQVVEGGVLGVATQGHQLKVGVEVRVLFRSGSCWESGFIEDITITDVMQRDSFGSFGSSTKVGNVVSLYNIRMVDGELLESIPPQYIECCDTHSIHVGMDPKMNTPEWYAMERVEVQKELQVRRQQRSELVKLVDLLDRVLSESRRQYRGVLTMRQQIETLDKRETTVSRGESYDDWWSGEKRPRRGEVVKVQYSNGWFTGRVLRARAQPASFVITQNIESQSKFADGQMVNRWLYDIGFAGDYVEKGMKLNRLAPPRDIDRNEVDGIEGEAKGEINGGGFAQLRVVICSLNMSHKSFHFTAGSTAAFEEWLPEGGRFESVALEDIDESADIVVVALQDKDIPDAKDQNLFQRPEDDVAERLGRNRFHLIAVVQRYQGMLQLLVFIRIPLIPGGGPEAMGVQSFAMDLEDEDISANKGRTEHSNGSCGGLAVQLRIDGITFRFVACRLIHDEGAQGSALRQKQLTALVDAVEQTFDVAKDSMESKSQHSFLFGDLGSRINFGNIVDQREHASFVRSLVDRGPLGWQKLYRYDDLHVSLENKQVLQGFITPDCDSFPPIFDSRCDRWAPHYGARCLVKSLEASYADVVCREYCYVYGRPYSNFTIPPQAHLRACFHVSYNIQAAPPASDAT